MSTRGSNKGPLARRRHTPTTRAIPCDDMRYANDDTSHAADGRQRRLDDTRYASGDASTTRATPRTTPRRHAPRLGRHELATDGHRRSTDGTSYAAADARYAADVTKCGFENKAATVS